MRPQVRKLVISYTNIHIEHPTKISQQKQRLNLILGHVVTTDEVLADPSRISAVIDWPQPKSNKELWGFLGLTSYYLKFVKGYGSL